MFPLFLKCIMEVMFCDGVQHRLRFCLDHFICVKMVTFELYLQSGKQRKVGWLKKTVILFLVNISLVKKEV
jgi:hypothetical protein